MADKITITSEQRRRVPVIAFLLSLFFPGFSQMYNGNPARGFIYLSARVILLLMIPAYMALYSRDSYLYFTIIMIILQILLNIISPIEAIYTAIKYRGIGIKWYNSIFAYFIYGVINLFIIIILISIILSFLSIKRVTDENMSPAIMPGEYVLINKFNLQRIKRGDVVICNQNDRNSIGRVIAISGDTVRSDSTKFYVNDVPLSIGVFADEDLLQMGLPNTENLFFEVNDNRRYPIIILHQKNHNRKSIKPIKMKDTEIFIVNDNRLSENNTAIIKHDDILGRVEGIIYSKILSRLFVLQNQDI